MRQPWLRRRAGVGLIAFAMLAAACGGAAESGVNVKTVATDLTYGIPQEPKSAAPANTDPTPADPLGTVNKGGAFDRKPIKIPTRETRTELCPETPPTVFPPPAPAKIAGTPKKGQYLWVVEGEQTIVELGTTVELPTIVQRKVTDAGQANGGPRFTVSERDLVFGSRFTVYTTYEYREGTINETLEGQNVDVSGLYIVKIERIHSSNRDVNSEFNPSPPILVLPQPAVLGDSVNSTGIDPVSFEVLRQTGTLTKKLRVDACGKPMDVFYVETVQEFVSADGTTQRRKFHYGIATAMGGLPIIEDIQSPCVESTDGGCAKDAVTFDMKAHIGRLEPL